jgi:hypothetical protein
MYCDEQHLIIRQIFICKWGSYYAMQVIKLGQVVAREVQSKPLRAFTHEPFEPKKLQLTK